MSSRLRAHLDHVITQAQHSIGKLFVTTRVHDLSGDRCLRLLGDTIALGEQRNRYELRVHPAISEHEVVPGLAPLQFTFVAFSPTGQLRERRDAAERTRLPGQPNHAFVEMCTNLAPFSPEVASIVATVGDELEQLWPARTFAYLVMATSAELDLVAVFADSVSLKQLAINMGKRAVAQA